MQRALSAFFAPDVLGLLLLAVVGVFVFFLARRCDQDDSEEFWLAFMQQHQEGSSLGPRARSKLGMPKAEGVDHVSGDRAARPSGF